MLNVIWKEILWFSKNNFFSEDLQTFYGRVKVRPIPIGLNVLLVCSRFVTYGEALWWMINGTKWSGLKGTKPPPWSLPREYFYYLVLGDWKYLWHTFSTETMTFPKYPKTTMFFYREKLNSLLTSMFPCIINVSAWPMVIKHFLHMRDNVGCQLLKRNVKIGAMVVENTDNINN